MSHGQHDLTMQQVRWAAIVASFKDKKSRRESNFSFTVCTNWAWLSLAPQRAALHPRDQLGPLRLQLLVFFEAPLHVVSMRLGVVGPTLLLEEILHLGDVVLHQDLALLSGRSSLQVMESRCEVSRGRPAAVVMNCMRQTLPSQAGP